jgi:hypothetical protein
MLRPILCYSLSAGFSDWNPEAGGLSPNTIWARPPDECRGMTVQIEPDPAAQIVNALRTRENRTRLAELSVFFRQPTAPIFNLPAQAGYGDKRPLQ